MKLKETALANAAGVLGAVYYLACYVVATLAPDIYKMIAESWMHMIDLSRLWKSAPEGLAVGLVSFTVMAWVSGWLLGWTYNRFVRK